MKARRRLAALTLTALAALTGCTGFQTAGEVTVGLQIGEIAPVDFSWVPSGPQVGAEPRDIVQGFLDAAIAPEEGWRTAKLFLSDDFAPQWNPAAGTVVDTASKRTIVDLTTAPTPAPTITPAGADKDADEDADADEPSPVIDPTRVTIAMSVSATATVDQAGAYRVVDSGTMNWSFDLQTQPDGQWRITRAPDGVLIDRYSFENVYDNYDLAFFDPTWTFLVPDTRWYPDVTAVRDVVNGLVAGASPWLAGAVSTAIPEGARALAAIPVDVNGVANVTLSGIDGLSEAAIGRVKLQLLESLSHTSVRDLVLSSDTREFGAPLGAVTPIPTTARPLVGMSDGFGYLTSNGLDNLDNFDVAQLNFAVRSWEMSEPAGHGVALSESGTVVRVNLNADDHVTVDVRDDLARPTIGPFGDVWTVPHSAPAKLVVTMPGGGATELPAGFAELTSVIDLQLSRDGTRLAVLGGIGSQTQLIVYGVLRNADGIVQSLGQGQIIRELKSGTPVALAWLDARTVGIVIPNDADTSVLVQPLSGPATTSRAVGGVVDIAGSNDVSTVWIRAKDGALYASRGTSWTNIAGDVLVLARQQGPAATRR